MKKFEYKTEVSGTVKLDDLALEMCKEMVSDGRFKNLNEAYESLVVDALDDPDTKEVKVIHIKEV